MANDKMIFPIGFDLEAGVKDAEKNADKYLRQIENAIKSRPIKLDVAINTGNGSISAIHKEMDSLVKEFDKLSEAQRVFNRTSGEYTPEAQKLIAKYAELTAATHTYAQSLQQITAAARKQADEQLKEQQRELKAYEDYWKRKEAENAKQAQADIAAGDRQHKAQQQRIAQEQAADAKRYQEWLRQKNQEAVEAERVERQKQQSRERTIAQQNREYAEERRLQQQRQEAISASLRAEYQRIEAKRQAEAASRRELQMLNQQYAAEERRQKLAAQEDRIKGLQKLRGVLQAEENTIANINAKLQLHQQRLQQAEVGSRAWRKSAEEVKRLTAELDKANQKMRELTGQTTAGANKQAAAIQNTNKAFANQSSYISRLIQRMAVYASISQLGNFLSKIREVTAEFELQRVSLGAIIQDQNRANALFTQIKGLALESPFKLLDLTKYTKQLAAYQIETDSLFDTMKRLADVSAGLGVSMDRLILAYGQTKATGYLRASEVRQFTEAGLPIVDQLAKKLSAANGEMVRAKDVMDMISKRQIPFEMVAEVFEDMTEKGGLFFDMQKKQGETLYGMWQKLGDAASIMFNEIGTNDIVNKVMKSTIGLATDLMRNWKAVGAALLPVAVALGRVLLAMKSAKLVQAANTAANIAHVNSIKAKIVALKAEAAASLRLSPLQRISVRTSLMQANAQLAAATSTNVLTKAMYRLKAAFLSNPWTFVLTAVASLIAYFATATDETEKLADSLEEIDDKYERIHNESGQNLTRLAEEAVHAADGTKKQKDALEELSRTYGDMIPQELLTIENLRKMKGEYSELVALIDEYNVKRKYEERKSAIETSYKTQISDAEENLRDWLNAHGVSDDNPLQSQIVQEIKDAVLAGEDAERATYHILDKYINHINGTAELLSAATTALNGVLFHPNKSMDSFEALANPHEYYEFAKAIEAYNAALSDNDAQLQSETDELNRYTQYVDRAKKAVDAVSENPVALKLMLEYDLPDDTEIASQIQNLMSGNIGSIEVDPTKIKEIDNQIYELGKTIDSLKKEKNELGNAFPIADERKLANAERQVQLLEQQRGDLILFKSDLEGFDWTNLAPSEQLTQLTDIRIMHIRKQVEEMFAKAGLQIPKDWAQNVYGQWRANFELLLTLAGNDQRLKAKLLEINKLWEQLAPTDTITQIAQQNVREIADETGMSAKTTESALKKSGESWEEYAERVRNAIQNVILAKIANLKGEIRDLEDELQGAPEDNWVMPAAGELRQKREDLKQYEKDLEGMTKVAEYANRHVYQEGKKSGRSGRGGRGGSKQDPRLQNLKEEISLVQKLYNEYTQLEKQEGADKAAADMRKLAGATIDMFKGKYGFGLPEDAEDLTAALEILYKKMAALPKKVFPSLDKDLKELRWTIEKVNIDDSQKNIEEQLKQLADRISRTKTAKEFYDKVLGMTGDVALAGNVAESIFGDNGGELKRRLAEQIRALANGLKLSDGIISADNIVDYKALRKWAELNKENLGKTYDELVKIADQGQKDMAKTYEGYLKDLEKAKSYSDKRIELARYTANKIAEINDSDYSEEEKARLTAGYREREDREAAKLEYEAFKDTPLYTQMFEDLDYASTSALERMRDRLIQLKGEWKNLDPTQIKELQSRLEEIDSQLATRNPFKALAKSWSDWQALRRSGHTKEGDEAAAQEAEDARKAAWERMMSDEAAYQAMVRMSGASSHAAIAMRAVADASKEAYDKAEKTANETAAQAGKWKGLSKGIAEANEAIDKYQETVNKALDQILDMAEVLGADADDMEFFRSMKEGFNQIFDGAQSAATAFGQFAAGDYFNGAMSSVSAITGIVSGISNLFSAGKVRKANREIKRQQEILEQLEYTYGRLQAAADKLFGTDYINNYNKQIEVLQAQQTAYLRQAEAERSKGKKADKERIKEYENQAREAADSILEMEDEIINRMTGTDRQSVAREWAQSWIEAKTAFESTTDVIKSKYKDMIKSMIIEGAAARIIEAVLAPMWESASAMFKKGDIDEAIDYIINSYDTMINTTDRAMNTFWEGLRAKGYDIDELTGSNEDKASKATGIKRDYATDSEESINGLTTAVNTQNWYISHVPAIASDVQALRVFLEAGSALDTANANRLLDLQQQSLGNLQGIERHTAETVNECKRIAKECVEQTKLLSRVVTNKNGGSAYGVQVFMR